MVDTPRSGSRVPGCSTGTPVDGESVPKDEELMEASTTTTPDVAYPEGIKLALLLLAVFVNMFLVALHQVHLPIRILLFEIGSAICGAAPSSIAFIIGRAIAGLGSAGIMSGTLVLVVYAIPLRKRPMYQGIFGAVFGLSSIIGPLLGGVFTTGAT
ncbi:hypothetical protein DL770_005098 [Monosporascus sp. CRB-9-2]|nr:hypothetical protein DL770_005098 [Monosporascus sp. CRB-9-2]